MANEPEFYTYRFNDLAKSSDLLDLTGLERPIHQSVGPCLLSPESYKVVTATFKGRPNCLKHLKNGEGVIPSLAGAVRVDENFLGITPLNHVEDAEADLIAVHALGGRAFQSWQNERGTMWLRDFLPINLPKVQVFVYGYPSRMKNSQSRASIQDYTAGFISAVSSIRSTAQEQRSERPLLLVGHSLGCLLIKAAISQASASEKPIPELYRSLCGIVFFGAPHRGLHNPELVALFKGQPPDQLLSDLEPESPFLIWLNQRFPSVCKNIRVISCYETHETAGPRLIDPANPALGFSRDGVLRFQVPRTSACLDWPDEWEVRIPIHADHSGIAKFDDNIGSPYFEILKEIQSIVANAHNIIEKRRNEAQNSQDLLDIFISLQYEVSWFNCWIAKARGDIEFTGNFSPDLSGSTQRSVPYGHLGYPSTAEANWILTTILDLLQPHRMSGKPGKPIAALTSSSAVQHVSLIGLPMTFSNEMPKEMPKESVTPFPPKALFDLTDWSVRDKTEFGALVERLHQTNENLSNIDSGLVLSSDLIATSSVFNSFRVPAGGLLSLADAVSRQRQRWFSPLKQRADFLQRYNDAIGTGPPLFNIRSIERRESSELSNFRLVSPLRLGQSNKEADSINERRVLVEWRSYQMASTKAKQQAAKDQALQISRDLSIDKKPPMLRVLDCIGLVQDWDNNHFGFLFQMPDWANVETGPVSLQSCLRRDRINGRPISLPTLSDRIRLARSLAYTLTELHFTGILHRDLNSGNVLLFQDRVTGMIAMKNPYIGGFGISRPEHDESLSLSASREPFDEYKHPELRDPSLLSINAEAASFRRRYDVYSLGILLLEIALWKPLTSFIPRGHSAAETAKKLLTIARMNLPHHMDTIYTDAVLDCIDFEHPWLGDSSEELKDMSRQSAFQNDDEKPMEYLGVFVEKVVRRLEAFHSQL